MHSSWPLFFFRMFTLQSSPITARFAYHLKFKFWQSSTTTVLVLYTIPRFTSPRHIVFLWYWNDGCLFICWRRKRACVKTLSIEYTKWMSQTKHVVDGSQRQVFHPLKVEDNCFRIALIKLKFWIPNLNRCSQKRILHSSRNYLGQITQLLILLL